MGITPHRGHHQLSNVEVYMPVDRRYRRTKRRPTRTDMRAQTPLYQHSFDENPNFRVISFDGSFWIHPYTGHAIPLHNRSWREVAHEALSSETPSPGHEPLALFKLYRTLVDVVT